MMTEEKETLQAKWNAETEATRSMELEKEDVSKLLAANVRLTEANDLLAKELSELPIKLGSIRLNLEEKEAELSSLLEAKTDLIKEEEALQNRLDEELAIKEGSSRYIDHEKEKELLRVMEANGRLSKETSTLHIELHDSPHQLGSIRMSLEEKESEL